MNKANFKQISRTILLVVLLIPVFVITKCILNEEMDLMIQNGFKETIKLDGCFFNGVALEGCSIELSAGRSTFTSPMESTYPDKNELKLNVIVSVQSKEHTCQILKTHHKCVSEIRISQKGLFCGECLSIF